MLVLFTYFCGSSSNLALNSAFLLILFSKFSASLRNQAESIFSGFCDRVSKVREDGI